jgi:CAAX protease family protein
VSAQIPPRPDVFRPAEPGAGGSVRSTWEWWEALGVYIVAFIVAGFATLPIIAALGQSPSAEGIGGSEIVATIAADVVLTAILLWWLQRRHREWRRAMVLPTGRDVWREAGFGLAAGIVLVPASGIVTLVLETVMSAGLGRDVGAPQQVASDLSPAAAAAAVVLAVVFAPISEEFFFRGILFRTLRDRHGFLPSAVGSAIPFGLVHYVNAPWQDAMLLQVTMVFIGIALAWVYERRGNLGANVAAHMTFNAIGITLILTGFG